MVNINKNEPLIKSPSLIDQLFMLGLMITGVSAISALTLMWLLGYPQTFDWYLLSFIHVWPSVGIVFLTYIGGQVLVAKGVCKYDFVKYYISDEIPSILILVFSAILTVVIIDNTVGIFSSPGVVTSILLGILDVSNVVAGFLLSIPGVLVTSIKSGKGECRDERIIAGPVFATILGIILWVSVFKMSLPALIQTNEVIHQHNILAFTMYFSLFMAAFNSFPVNGTDGWEVWVSGDKFTQFLVIGTIVVPLSILII